MDLEMSEWWRRSREWTRTRLSLSLDKQVQGVGGIVGKEWKT